MSYRMTITATCDRCQAKLTASTNKKSADGHIDMSMGLDLLMDDAKWIQRNMGYGKPQTYCSVCADLPSLTKKQALLHLKGAS